MESGKVRGVRASSKVVFCVQDIFNTNTKAAPAGRVPKSLQATLVVYFYVKFVRKIVIPDIPGLSGNLPDTEHLPVSCTAHQILLF